MVGGRFFLVEWGFLVSWAARAIWVIWVDHWLGMRTLRISIHMSTHRSVDTHPSLHSVSELHPWALSHSLLWRDMEGRKEDKWVWQVLTFWLRRWQMNKWHRTEGTNKRLAESSKGEHRLAGRVLFQNHSCWRNSSILNIVGLKLFYLDPSLFEK